MINKVLVFFILGLLFLAGCEQRKCVYNVPKKIMSVRTGEGEAYLYWDYVLADSLYRGCLDSTRTIDILNKYIEGREFGNAMYKVSILNKVEDFDSRENLSQPKSFFKNVLIDVYFDTSNYKPIEFVFYDDSHKEVYRGASWYK